MKIKLKTITPVHIGSGEKYSYGDAYVDSRGILHRCEIDYSEVNVEEMIDRMENAYYVQSILQKYGKDIYTARCRANISFKGRMQEVIKREVREFIKDGRYPYIPGSSIKGAIRTLLYAYYLNITNWEVYTPGGRKNFIDLLRNGERMLRIYPLGRDKEDDRKKYYGKGYGKRFEQLVFTYSNDTNPKKWKDAKYDIMKFVEVSDFYPVSGRYSLYIDSVKTYSLRKEGLYPKGFVTYLESVEGEFEGTIRISPLLGKVLKSERNGILENKLNLLGLTKDVAYSPEKATEKFIEHLKNASKYFYEISMDHDDQIGHRHPENVKNKEFKLRIGFGVGTHYQTILEVLERVNQNIVKNVISQNTLTKYYRQYPNIPYPKTFEVIEYNGKKIPLGWMEVKYG